MSTSPAIQTEHLTKRFGQRIAVDNLSLEVGRGEVFGLLGPNGAGKTTTIGMLLGLVRPTSGRARVLGYDITRQPAAALQHVGAMIEAPAFYPYLSGWDNLRVLALADGLPAAQIDSALAAVELTPRAGDRFGTYSQGMKQRLAIAAALLANPALLILDEPTNGLDPAGTVEVRELIRTLAAGGHTILLCSHQLNEVQQLCQRVAILKEGRLLAQGAVADLLRREEGVHVRVEGDPAPAVAALHAAGWTHTTVQAGGGLLVDAPAEAAAAINRLLVQRDIAVVELGTRAVSLEDFFLEVTGEHD